MAEVDDEQLAALRRLRAAFGFVEVVEVIRHDSDDDLTAPRGGPIEGARMADPDRMTAEEGEQARALLARVLRDPDWETASQVLDDLMRMLLVVHRLLEAEERHAKREPRGNSMKSFTYQSARFGNRLTSVHRPERSIWYPVH